MPFLPPDFAVPARAQTPRFTLRMLSIHEVVKDFDAVMSSREHLWARFGGVWGWPAADLTLEQDLIDLAWHQKEFQRRSSYAYALMSPDEARLLGCVYVDPPEREGADAEVWFWGRSSELASGLEDEIEAFVVGWLAREWPFGSVRLQGVLQEVRVPPL